MNEQKVMAKTAYLALDEKKGEDMRAEGMQLVQN